MYKCFIKKNRQFKLMTNNLKDNPFWAKILRNKEQKFVPAQTTHLDYCTTCHTYIGRSSGIYQVSKSFVFLPDAFLLPSYSTLQKD